MPRKRKNPVTLSDEDRGKLESLIAHGHAPARELTHARILRKKRWSVRLLAERFVSLECAEEPISRELVRRTLKKVP